MKLRHAGDFDRICSMETAERRIKVPTTGMFDFPTLIEGGKGMYIDKPA